MDGDEEVVFAPNGTAIGETELTLIREAYDDWKFETGQHDMSLAEYATRIFFSGCKPELDEDEEADLGNENENESESAPVARSMYPDLSAEADAPRMDFAEGALIDLNYEASVAPTASRSDTTSESLPVLDRVVVPVSSELHGLQTSVGRAGERAPLPVLERSLNTAYECGFPVLERKEVETLTRGAPLRTSYPEGTAASTLSGMPALRKLDAAVPVLKRAATPESLRDVPTLNRVAPQIRSMPALRRISAPAKAKARLPYASSVPTLARIVNRGPRTCPHSNPLDEPFLSEADISRVVESVRGLSVASEVAPRASTQIDAPALAKHFELLRDGYARNAAAFENTACASDGGMLSLAAEMRGVLAGIESDDLECACTAATMHLDPNRVDPDDAAFVSAARALSESIDSHGPERVRSALISIFLREKPKTHQPAAWAKKNLKNFNEAWGALVARVVGAAMQNLNGGPADLWRETFRHFDPVFGATVNLSALQAENINSRAALAFWADAAATITTRVLVMVAQEERIFFQNTADWVMHLIQEVSLLESKVQKSKRESMWGEFHKTLGSKPLSELTRTQRKVKQGFDILLRHVVKGGHEKPAVSVTASLVQLGLTEPFLARRTAVVADTEAYGKDTAAIFVTLIAGMLLANRVAEAIMVGGFDRRGTVRPVLVQLLAELREHLQGTLDARAQRQKS
jgi:hypothetical protein